MANATNRNNFFMDCSPSCRFVRRFEYIQRALQAAWERGEDFHTWVELLLHFRGAQRCPREVAVQRARMDNSDVPRELACHAHHLEMREDHHDKAKRPRDDRAG